MIPNTTKLMRGLTLGAALAAVTLAAAPSVAKSANPKLIPVKSAYVITMPDVPAFWTAWKANSIYSTYNKVIANPDVKAKIEDFEKQLKTIETALGFPLDGDTLSQVIKSADIYMQVGESLDDGMMAFVLTVSDKAKLQKLLDLAEKAAIKASSETDTTTTETTTTVVKPAVEEYKGVSYRKIPGKYETPYYAQTGDFLFITNSRDEIRALIDRSKIESKEELLAGNAQYERIAKALELHPGEVYYLMNPKSAYKLQGDVPAPMKALQDMVMGLSPDTMGGASIKINPKDIEGYSYQPFSDASKSPWLALFKSHPAVKQMEVMGFAPSNAMIALGINIIDMPLFYSGAKEVAKATSGGSPEADLDNQLKSAEPLLGFSVTNDLLPAFGNEMGLMVNSVRISAGSEIPDVDAAFVFGVKDKQKMQKVLDALEKMVTTQVGALTGAASTDPGNSAPAGFKSEKVGNDTIKYYPVPISPTFAPGFVLTGNHLLIGTNKESMKKMIALKSQPENGLSASPVYKELAARVGMDANIVQYSNLTAVWEALLSMPNLGDAKPFIEALRVFKTVYGVQSSDADGALVGKGILLLN